MQPAIEIQPLVKIFSLSFYSVKKKLLSIYVVFSFIKSLLFFIKTQKVTVNLFINEYKKNL